MSTPLYPNGENTPSKSSSPLKPENTIDLLPEHGAEINLAIMGQLCKTIMRPEETQIFTAVYYQTIGCKRREKHINSSSLHEMTGLPDEQANQTLVFLAESNILMVRESLYGQWVSVNFDFANWRKYAPDTQTNDPNVVLSTYHRLPHVEDRAFEIYLREK